MDPRTWSIIEVLKCRKGASFPLNTHECKWAGQAIHDDDDDDDDDGGA